MTSTTALPPGYRTYIVEEESVRDPVRFLLHDGDDADATQATPKKQEQQHHQQKQDAMLRSPVPPPSTPPPPSLRRPASVVSSERRSPSSCGGGGGGDITFYRPLSATLNRIMTDTTPEPAAHDKNSQRGLFCSQFHYDKEESLQYGPMMRIGVYFNDKEHLLHLPNGYRGTKSFVVPRPATVEEVRRQAAFVLQVNVVDVEIGYWSAKMEPVHVTCDEELRVYLSRQVRVVPFVHAFVTGCTEVPGLPECNNNDAQQDEEEEQQQDVEEQHEQSPLELDADVAQQQEEQEEKEEDSGSDNSSSDSDFFNIPASRATDATPPPSALVSPTPKKPHHHQQPSSVPSPPPRVQRPVSAPASRVLQQQEHEDKKQQHQQQHQHDVAKPVANSTTTAAHRPSSAVHRRPTHQQQQLAAVANSTTTLNSGGMRVAPSANSERGLDVLPPVPSASSFSSAWRLGVDNTPAATGRTTTARSATALSSRPHSSASVARLLGPSSTLSMMGSLPQNLFNLFENGGKVNESVLDKIYEQLLHQTRQVVLGTNYASRPASAASTNNNSNCVGDDAGGGGGVLPSVLLDYLDVHMDSLGDRRRWERAMGYLLMKRRLSKDHVAYVLCKVARE